MRYSDDELFEYPRATLNDMKDVITFNLFCEWAIHRLKELIEKSTNENDWMQADANHLRNYRACAIKFYEQKKGK